MYNLEELSLARNKIESIDDDIINLKKLRFLNMNDNNIKYISHNISELSKLYKLYFHSNRSLKRLPFSLIKLKGIDVNLYNTSINNDEKLYNSYEHSLDWDEKGLTKYLLNEKKRSDNIKDNINIFINSFDLNSHLWFNIYCIKMIMKKYYYIEMDNI